MKTYRIKSGDRLRAVFLAMRVHADEGKGYPRSDSPEYRRSSEAFVLACTLQHVNLDDGAYRHMDALTALAEAAQPDYPAYSLAMIGELQVVLRRPFSPRAGAAYRAEEAEKEVNLEESRRRWQETKDRLAAGPIEMQG